MDTFTHHVLAGHTLHPSDADILQAMERVRAGRKIGHKPGTAVFGGMRKGLDCNAGIEPATWDGYANPPRTQPSSQTQN